MGLVKEIDSHCLNMEIVELARVKILHPVSVAIPKTLLLDVEDLRFQLWTEVEPRSVVSMEDLVVKCGVQWDLCPLVVSEEEESGVGICLDDSNQ